MARIIDGSEIGRAIRDEIAAEVAVLRDEGIVPGLAVVLAGNDPASEVYVRMKGRACRSVGMEERTIHLPPEVSRPELFGVLDGLNSDPGVHGILVQLPLPEHLSSKDVLARVHPNKDVDGFHPLNVGRAFVGDPVAFVPATPLGIMELLRRAEIPTRGRHVVIIGRSLIVGKPLASLLMAPGPDATVTLAHRHTVGLGDHTRTADILISAAGKPGLITVDMVKAGAAVIDVGTTRVPDEDAANGYRLAGDVDFDAVAEIADAITPVPGGVGPMTITMLLQNTLTAAKRELQSRRRRPARHRSRP